MSSSAQHLSHGLSYRARLCPSHLNFTPIFPSANPESSKSLAPHSPRPGLTLPALALREPALTVLSLLTQEKVPSFPAGQPGDPWRAGQWGQGWPEAKGKVAGATAAWGISRVPHPMAISRTELPTQAPGLERRDTWCDRKDSSVDTEV